MSGRREGRAAPVGVLGDEPHSPSTLSGNSGSSTIWMARQAAKVRVPLTPPRWHQRGPVFHLPQLLSGLLVELLRFPPDQRLSWPPSPG
jgi:hypothetical protein